VTPKAMKMDDHQQVMGDMEATEKRVSGTVEPHVLIPAVADARITVLPLSPVAVRDVLSGLDADALAAVPREHLLDLRNRIDTALGRGLGGRPRLALDDALLARVRAGEVGVKQAADEAGVSVRTIERRIVS